ncbi:hypothetical protein KIW84_040732 [Lathyrus oleraceus]|uniref:GPI ethanolamine phosphate transferase 3 n=1 Tax=Pisum sativum TaxID=3888 RepID=A0A9D4X897_PEA|nr:hypothetical protein KIW84_040732 [Pisum sativum]
MEGAVIGRINPELYALGAGSWKSEASQKLPGSDVWMKNYANALCINTWQVKRYIDAYSASSAVGFSHDDLSRIASVYAEAENHWLHSTKKLLLDSDGDSDALVPALKWQIDAYFKFLTTVSELARSKWTEFDLNMMGSGIGIMLMSLIFQVFAILRATKQLGVNSSSLSGNSSIITSSSFTLFLLGIRSCSLLSNSYILEEGKVANFLLSTSGIVALRQSVIKEKLLTESIGFLLLSTLCRFAIEVGLSKQAATSAFMKDYSSWIANIASNLPVWDYTAKFIPMLVLILLAFWLYKATNCSFFDWPWKYVILGTILCYMLIIVHWVTDRDGFGVALMPESIGKSYIPRIVYAISLGQLLLLAYGQLFKRNCLDCKTKLVTKTTTMLSAWSSTVILLSGKQGPIIAVASIVGGYCIMRLDNIEDVGKNRPGRSFSIMQWSLFATCVFFCSGHWCAFDGLRYGAAFIGFEEFMLVRQAILLAIDTFGFSIILPVFGLPFLVASKYHDNLGKHFIFTQLSQMYTTYGLITAVITTFTILCVTIQRRHLMVWGLFAPKFVFDVFELILTDVLICLASIYYFDQGNDDELEVKSSDY